MADKVPNQVKEIRESEGLPRTHLAALTALSERTIRRVEDGKNCAPATKHRILNALNKRPNRLKDYEYNDLYPNEPAKKAVTDT